MSFADGTLIAVPGGVKPVEAIQIGDEVLAGWLAQAGVPQSGTPQFSWKATPVQLSEGESGEILEVIYFAYETFKLVCTKDQVFMLQDGSLIRASSLTAGTPLVSKDGGLAAVKTVALGKYAGGIQAISTPVDSTKNVDGHLLQAGGLVAGDFWLEMNLDGATESGKS
jgi:hypothetical protein